MFADLLSSNTSELAANEDELTAYLSTPCENVSDEDVLLWWRRQTQFPRLSVMAISYLTCPGKSSAHSCPGTNID